ncbi:protein Cep89 homolog [Coccinella septempunctata]|uniref:protein Cep89 homolog n=1 Tax=Coccinella septempunctata TaxID=41139 RepID=UPI001D075020|nr:protein Cep89 homolog [Coccinella septempunctata]
MRNIAQKWQELISNCFVGDKIMYATRSRLKDPEVPIHRNQQENELHVAKKTTRKHRCRSREKQARSSQFPAQEASDENDNYPKISKKQLWKDNLQLTREKEEVIAKFNELEDLSVKKITKLREKVSGLQNEKFEIDQENQILKSRLEGLSREYEEVRDLLEQYKVCQNCEEFKIALEQFSSENSSLKKSKVELSEDLDMLKTVVFRLNVQLERYQEKLRNNNIKDTIEKSANHFLTAEQQIVGDISREFPQESSHASHPHLPISWGKVNSHTLGPMLEAFQETINEKDEIINEYEAEFSVFSGKLKEVLSENEKLHYRLNEDGQCSGKLREELTILRKELEGCKDQNDALIKKCALKQDKVDEILKVYETKVEQMKRDYNVLHEQYYKCRNELTTLNERNKALAQTQEDFKNEKKNYIPISVHTASVNECKKWYEELKTQYEKEKEKLKVELEQHLKEIGDLKDKISIVQKEKQDKEDKIKQLEKLIRKGEAKYLELEQALNECQVSRTACKKQLHKAMSFAKDLVTEQETLLKALNHRQQENKMVTKIGADMAFKMDSLKTQLKEVQRGAWQELNTVEGRIQEQEQTIEQMKEEYEKEIDRLEQIIKRQTDQSILLKTQNNLPISPYVHYKNKIQESE